MTTSTPSIGGGRDAPQVTIAGPSGHRESQLGKKPLQRRLLGLFRWRFLKFVILLFIFGTFMKWAVLAPAMHEVDASVDFAPTVAPPGGSAAVAMAAGLIDREVNYHGWTPNDPVFYPTAPLDNMPNFQIGMMRATSWFTIELLDQIGRVRGSGANDGDLERAAGLLQFPPDVWIIDPDTSWLPTATSEEQYRSAIQLLQRYNSRIASGQAVFELRADALATTLRQMSVDLASQAAQIDRVTGGERRLFDTSADDLFYQNKGMLYAYYMILNSLGSDFDSLIGERTLRLGWNQALADLRDGSQLRPLVVLNADSDRSVFANHLMLQGFYMKRAILQLEEVVNVLAV